MTKLFGIGITVCTLAFASGVAVYGAEKAAPAQTSGLDRAIQDYVDKIQSDQQKVAEAAVTNKLKDLTQDPGSPVLGDPNGDVTIVEFFDYQCPYCKAIEPRVEKLIKDDKRVKVVIKEYPVLGPESLVASKAALASIKQGKYETFHQALMGYRGQLTTDVIFKTATDVGLNIEKLRKDMEAPEVSNQIIANLILARSVKMSVIPGLIIGTNVLSGLSTKTETSKIDFPAEVAAARAKKM